LQLLKTTAGLGSGSLDQHSEDREHYVEVLNAQEEGFDVVWGNEEDFDFDALD
jgi:hypothetical protein